MSSILSINLAEEHYKYSMCDLICDVISCCVLKLQHG